ncbi:MULTISPECIES: hypothetical protein [unclassified Sphingomonas]|uniref:hypothetical protein n=1 Tax=Sphingomonas sp. PvP015 TaxID=3156388 RepID=UPI003399B9E5
MNPDDAQPHLYKQLAYIDRSSIAYDGGEDDEAIRIAQALRVVFHDTKNSTSILDLFGAKDTIRILSKMNPSGLPADASYAEGLSAIGQKSGDLWHFPKMSRDNDDRFITAEEWWREEIFAVSGFRLSRQSIVCDAANFDGGSHAKLKLPERYRALNESLVRVGPGDGLQTIGPTKASLRTMAFEVLNSPDLMALAGSDVSEWSSNDQRLNIEGNVSFSSISFGPAKAIVPKIAIFPLKLTKYSYSGGVVNCEFASRSGGGAVVQIDKVIGDSKYRHWDYQGRVLGGIMLKPGVYDINLREFLFGAINSPRDHVITLKVNDDYQIAISIS